MEGNVAGICFSSRPSFDLDFLEIRIDCIKLHQALILYEKGWLLLQSSHNRQVSAIEMAVLTFLYRLSFVSVLTCALVAKMLTPMKKHYYFSYYCIFWDLGNQVVFLGIKNRYECEYLL